VLPSVLLLVLVVAHGTPHTARVPGATVVSASHALLKLK
jgi:hypothetical protein